MSSERRKHPRFLPQKQTLVVMRPQFIKLGKLIDISRGGLAFHYIDSKGQEEVSNQLDMFTKDNSFFLSSIPCKIIYDVKKDRGFCLETRQCGVQFGELTKRQADQLELYLTRTTPLGGCSEEDRNVQKTIII